MVVSGAGRGANVATIGVATLVDVRVCAKGGGAKTVVEGTLTAPVVLVTPRGCLPKADSLTIMLLLPAPIWYRLLICCILAFRSILK